MKATLRLAISLLIVAVVLAGIAGGIGGVFYLRQEAQNRPLADAKSWSNIIVPYLENVTLTLSTKWQDSYIYYQFNLGGYPAPIRKALESTGNAWMEEKYFSIVFLDRSGFKLHTIKIPLRSMSGTAIKEGGFSGLSINEKEYMSADVYRQIVSWNVSWIL